MPDNDPDEKPSSPRSTQPAFKRNSLRSSRRSSQSTTQQIPSQPSSPARERPTPYLQTRGDSAENVPRPRTGSSASAGKTRRESTSEVPGLAQPVGARVKGLRTSLVAGKVGDVDLGKAGDADKVGDAAGQAKNDDKKEHEVLKQVNQGSVLRDGQELDDFGLPIRPRRRKVVDSDSEGSGEFEDAEESWEHGRKRGVEQRESAGKEGDDHGEGMKETDSKVDKLPEGLDKAVQDQKADMESEASKNDANKEPENIKAVKDSSALATDSTKPRSDSNISRGSGLSGRPRADSALAQIVEAGREGAENEHGGVSQFSHQALTVQKLQEKDEEEEKWQAMPAYGKFDLYDDDGRLVAKGIDDSDSEEDGNKKGGAGRGYTRVQLDDDAQSQTSMDENTRYLFKDKSATTALQDEDDDVRDPLSQMQATKDLLTEGQRIAYVGVTRLSMVKLLDELESIESTRGNKKYLLMGIESMKMWSQRMMVRLYAHMEISSSEQIMIEQLAEHGVQPSDLVPALMQNARVKNPMAEEMEDDGKDVGKESEKDAEKEVEKDTGKEGEKDTSKQDSKDEKEPKASLDTSPDLKEDRKQSMSSDLSGDSDAPPAYDMHQNDDMELQDPSTFKDKNIDIDLRWTVLCDLFLVLIADSIYDSRSRTLLETVGNAMQISWQDICRFEKRVTDALEMQEAANRENWDEAEHMESRRKMALKRRYMVMGLATVGGSLVIGLSAGLLAPVIGAGLAAGFTTIGVAGTSGFLAGAGGAALITTGSAVSGGIIAVRASNRRTGAVKTFEYRPLHNNKRVNLIVTVAGWMNGKVDDVRLPFSTVDPIMGDIYSVLWEPDMLRSMGDTIRILATEALTQGLQQVLASTILTALMASLSLPIILAKLAYLLDNPWSVSLDRADAAGLILADSLVDRNLGVRPITLVGFSLGARVVYSALKELANKGAYGLVQNVYLFGSPMVASKDEYTKARTVVSGRFVNAYSTNDWILGYLFRATKGGISRVAGLAAIEDIPGLENKDVTALVNGHMAYRAAMPRLLREVGWEVESDEFTEIEDPDPENHESRQRELIKEIEDARKEAEEKANQKKKTRWWQRAPKEKKGWETYEIDDKSPSAGAAAADKDGKENYNPVIFDIEAIRRELESEQLEVRQLESTLPPMQININKPPPPPQDPSSSKPSSKPPSATNSPNPGSSTPTISRSSTSTPGPGHPASKPAPRPSYSSWDDYDAAHAQPTMSFEAPPTPGRNEKRSESADPGDRAGNRPELKSSATSPAVVGFAGAALGAGAGVGAGVGAAAGYNAWVEEEDLEESGGGEVVMSFE